MYEDSLGSLTIDARSASNSITGLERDFDALGLAVERTQARMNKEMEETVRESRRLAEVSREWKRLEESIGGSTAAMEKYNKLTGEADRALAAGRINADQHATALQRLGQRYKDMGEEAARSTKLAAHELNNLSFQVQDFAVQVGSGQGIFRPLIQQAPQAVGAVGGVGRAISLLMTPTTAAVAGFAALAGGAAVVASRVSEISEEARRLDATLRGLNPMLNANSESLRKMSFDVAGDTGATRRDAAAIVAQVVRNRQIVNAEMVKGISELAADMAPVLGGDAAKIGADLAGAFSRGAAGIRELDRELGFLSPEMARTIRTLDEGGHRAEAMGQAMDALKGRFGGAARSMESEWSKSTREMSNQWDLFVERVAKSDIVTNGAKIGTQMLKWVTPDTPDDKQAARLRELDELLTQKSGQLADAVGGGAKGRGVDLLREQVRGLQQEYYDLVKAISDAKRAQDDFAFGQGGKWGATGWNTAPAASGNAKGDKLNPDEQKRIDELQHAYDREREAMRGNSVERSLRLTGLAAENAAIDAGRTAQAAKEEGLIAERRALAQLSAGYGDAIDAMRLEVQGQEKVAIAARGGVAARMEAERAAQVAIRTSEMLRAAHAAETRGEEALAGQLRDLAGAYDDLSRRGTDAGKVGNLNEMTARNEAAARMSRAEAGTIGMNDADRQRVLAQIRAQNDLLQQGVDIQGDLAPEIRSAAQEYLKSVDAVTQLNTELEKQQKSWNTFADSFGDAFDRIGESVTDVFSGKKKPTLKNLFGDAFEGLNHDMLKGAVDGLFVSPIKGLFRDLMGSGFQAASGMQTTPPIGRAGAFLKLATKG